MVNKRSERGSLMLEVLVALEIVTVALIPLGFSFSQEQRACRRYYVHAIAMELVDGEMEVLAAGEWRAFQVGEQPYPVQAGSVRNLPPGRFVLTVRGKHLRLEWMPVKSDAGGTVVREAEGK